MRHPVRAMRAALASIVVAAIAIISGVPAEASTVYSDDFSSDTTGAIAPGWVNVIGTWLVKANNFDGTTNGFFDSSGAANDVAVASGISAGAVANMTFQYDTVVDPSGGLIFPVLRADGSGYSNAYLLTLGTDHTQAQFFKRVGGTYTKIGSSFATGYTTTAGDLVTVNAFVSGSTMGFAIWKKGATPPSTYSGILTDTSVTAAGYPGFFYNASGAASPQGISNVYEDNAPTTSSVNLLGTAANLALGTLSVTAQNASGITLSASESGGTAPYSNTVYRSTSYTFTPSQANAIATGVTFPYVDATATAGVRYTYIVGSSDSSSTVQTATSALAWAYRPSAVTNICDVGDSISYGDHTTIQSTASAMVHEMSALLAPALFTLTNNAVNGTTTTDWTPGANTNGANLTNAISACVTAGSTVAVIELGTNDGRTDRAIPTATSISNLQSIIAYVKSRLSGVKIVILEPMFIDYPRFGSVFAVSSGTSIDALDAAIPTLAGTNVAIGDVRGSQYGAQIDMTQLFDGIHPSDFGVPTFGALWANGVMRALGYSVGATATPSSASRLIRRY